ncbi:MAG: bacillithiol system redox-active protein YtxJ [Bacteroidia bacterium]|nr:bacillithiol system redox-active protein YtxJ [Bacteroidia bacterium]
MSKWKALTTAGDLDHLRKESFLRPQLIFKHSTRCGISHGALDRLESSVARLGEISDLYYLDLLSFRGLSNQIAEDFGIPHASPQILIIQEGKSTLNLTHYGIQVDSILKHIS